MLPRTAAVAGLVFLGAPLAAEAQDRPCVVLCAPELKFEPTVTIEHLGGGPTIDTDGQRVDEGSEAVFELVFALDVPTQLPRVGLSLEAIFAPFGETSTQPFAGLSAASAGGRAFRDNGVEIETEINIDVLEEDQTGGWVSSHVDLVDKFSPGETPRAGSVYTHKLNFEWDTAFHVFSRLPDGHWLRRVELEVSLDYVASGLPRAGDVIRGERFLDDANPWSLSFVSVIPLAPLAP